MVETIPFDPDDLRKDPLDNYGQAKLASEIYLKEPYQQNGFPATIIMPGQISGSGRTIINPWGNTSMRVFHDIADGKEIALPNFGQEILHHIHGHDVVRVFFKALPTKIRHQVKHSMPKNATIPVTTLPEVAYSVMAVKSHVDRGLITVSDHQRYRMAPFFSQEKINIRTNGACHASPSIIPPDVADG